MVQGTTDLVLKKTIENYKETWASMKSLNAEQATERNQIIHNKDSLQHKNIKNSSDMKGIAY